MARIDRDQILFNRIFTSALILIAGVILGWWVREVTGPQSSLDSVLEGFMVSNDNDPGHQPVRSPDHESAAEERALSETDILSKATTKSNSSDLLHQLANESSRLRIAEMRVFLRNNNDNFEILVALSRELSQQGEYEAALDLLLRSSFTRDGVAQQDEFEIVLARLVDSYTRELISLKQFDAVDRLLETLTLSIPELAQYFLQLGNLRIRMGNPQAALLPLAQISNHAALGAEARRLIAEIEETEFLVPDTTEQLPLIGTSGQFLVQAVVDGSEKITVLIDTGAAMTILETSVLERLGYNLSGRQGYFATANGVVQAPVVTIESLGLGNAILKKVTVGSLNLNMQGRIDGLLGMNFLRHYDFRIDQDRELLILDER